MPRAEKSAVPENKPKEDVAQNEDGRREKENKQTRSDLVGNILPGDLLLRLFGNYFSSNLSGLGDHFIHFYILHFGNIFFYHFSTY